MKTSIDEKLDKNLNIAPPAKKKTDVTVVDAKPVVATFPPDQPKRVSNSSDTIEDYKKSRTELKRVLELGGNALEEILIIAAQSEQPRAYEVAGQLIKNVGEVTEKLLQLQEKMKKLNDEVVKRPSKVTNALFVGSTTELQKMLKKDKE